MGDIIQPIKFLAEEEKTNYKKNLFTEKPIYYSSLPYYPEDTSDTTKYATKVGNLYIKGAAHHKFKLEEVINYNNLGDSTYKCCNGVRWKDSTIQYILNEISNTNEIIKSFYKGPLYMSDYFHTTIMERGKARLLSSLTFRDRVITKCINQYFVLPAFINTLIYDNCASIKGKGITFAIDRLYHHMEYCSRRYGYYYILKTDIKSYFDNISHEYMMNLIRRHTDDERLLKFFELYFRKIYYDGYIHNGEQVPFGVGLGSEISQSMGLICLNELDHIAQEKFGLKMVRYMDDSIYVSESKEKLINFLEYSRSIIANMGLVYNDNKTIITDCYQGTTFLKLHFRLSSDVKHCVFAVPLKSKIKKAKHKLFKMHELMIEGDIDFDDVRMSYNSLRGHLNMSDTHMLVNIMDQIFETLFIMDPFTYENDIYIPGERYRTKELEKEAKRKEREEEEKNKPPKKKKVLNYFVKQSIKEKGKEKDNIK